MEPEGSLPHSQEPATCPYQQIILNGQQEAKL
jgi:hypothetical protein